MTDVQPDLPEDRAGLEARRDELAERQADTRRQYGLDGPDTEITDFPQHEADAATDTYDRSVALATLEQIQAELDQVERRLSQLDADR